MKTNLILSASLKASPSTSSTAPSTSTSSTTTNNNTSSVLELATKNIVTEAYAHELLYKVGNELLHRHMYESALYAYGAGTAILLHEGYATISLYKSYVSTCIITLAMKK